MIKKQKLALLSVAGILGALTLGVTAATGGNGTIRTYGGEATVWKHYAAVEATETTHGSKEFWASCTPDASGKYGARVFEEPTTGIIEEGGNIQDTVYWDEIKEGDDRYVAPLDSTITFDARGGVAVEAGKYAYGAEASALPTTTREADEYYESYEFGGWYKDGVAYDKVAGSTTVKANWKYGDAKKVYVNDWKAEDFTLGTGIVTKKVADVSGCTLTDDEGFMFVPGSSADQENTVNIPAINFSSILDTVPTVYMPIGGYNSNNYLHVTTASGRKKLPENGSNDVKHLTKTMLRFTKDSAGTVHMHFADTELTNPMNYDGRTNRTGDLTLTTAQANGEEGILFDAKDRYGSTRYYWLGRPYYLNGEGNLLDVTTKTGFAVTGGTVRTKSEHTSGAGAAFWYEAVGGADEYVAILGNDASAGAKVTFDGTDLSTLFAAKKGIQFIIGGWNGNETFYFGDTAMGANGANLSGCDAYTVDQIEKTFHNWVVTIDDIGAHVYNKNEDKTYDIALTAGQIAGTENITMTLGKVSNGRCFFLSDIATYHF